MYIKDYSNGEINVADISHIQLESTNIHDHVIVNGQDAEGTSKHCSTHVLMTGTGSKATSLDIESHVIVAGVRSRALAADEMSHAIALDHSSKAIACGNDCVAMVMGCNSEAISTGENGVAINLGTAGFFAVGEDGCVIFSWDDGSRKRFKIMYAGEDIDPYTIYRFENGSIEKVEV